MFNHKSFWQHTQAGRAQLSVDKASFPGWQSRWYRRNMGVEHARVPARPATGSLPYPLKIS